MNIITISGVLGRDAELKYLNSGDPLLAFSVADSQGKDKSTIWWSCSFFGKRSESVAPFMQKGTGVTVSGEVTEREYTDKNGNQRKVMDVRVNNVFLHSRKDRREDPKEEAKPVDDGQIPF